MREYLALMRLPGAWRLTLGALPARIAYSMVNLVMFFHVKDLTGSISAAGIAIGASSVAASSTAALRGHMVDRFGQTRPLLVLVPAWSLSCFALAFAAKDFRSAVVLSALNGMSAAPINLSVRPLWKVIAGDQIRTAYALDTVVLNGTGMLGPVLGTWVALQFGGTAGMVLTGSLMLLGGSALLTSKISREWQSEPRVEGEPGVFRSRAIQVLALEGAFIGFGFGLFDVGVPAAATLAGVPEWSAISLAAASIGGIVGGILVGSRLKHLAPGVGLINTQNLFAIVALPLFLVAPGWQTALLLLLACLPLGMAQVFYLEVLDVVQPKGTAVTSLATLWFIEGSAAAGGSALAGVLAEKVGPQLPLIMVSVFFLLSATTLRVASRTVLKPAMTVSADSV